MSSTTASHASTRARLQLSLGPAALLGEQRTHQRDRTVFTATGRESRQPLVVTLYAAPPLGPDAEALRDRLDSLRQLEHRALELPRAMGVLDQRCWVVEVAPQSTSLRHLMLQGVMPLTEGVAAFRDLARALAALHHAGIHHGAIGVDTVLLRQGSALFTGLAWAHGANDRDDLDGLARVGWTLLSGERDNARGRHLSQIRRGVPPRLDALCMSLFAAELAARPVSADAILAALDQFPTRPRQSAIGELVGPALDGRRPPAVAWTVAMALLAIMVMGVLILRR